MGLDTYTYLGIFCLMSAIPLAVHLIACKIKKWKFDWLMWGGTALVSFLGALLLCQFCDPLMSWGERVIFMICFFGCPLLCGLIVVCIVEGVRGKKLTIHRPFSRISSFVIAIVGSLILGGVGQVLYDIGSKTVTTAATTDLVLLLDGSSSMNGYKEPCADAASVLVDSLDEEYRVQVISFAAKVLGETDFLYMDASGKSEVQHFMQAIDVTGGTNFDAALETAMDTLEDNEEKDRGQAVILLTDGDGPLSNSVKQAYQNSDVKLYTIRITGNSSNNTASELIELAQDTGGFDTEVATNNTGLVDTDEMLQAFQNAFAGSQKTESDDQLLLFAYYNSWNGPSPIQRVLRVLIFGLYSILIAWTYYGPQNVVGMIFHGVLGGALAIFFWEIWYYGPFLGEITGLFHALCWSAYTVYRPADGVELGEGNAGGIGVKRPKVTKLPKQAKGGKVGRKAKKEDAHV